MSLRDAGSRQWALGPACRRPARGGIVFTKMMVGAALVLISSLAWAGPPPPLPIDSVWATPKTLIGAIAGGLSIALDDLPRAIKDGVDTFTERLRAHPKNAHLYIMRAKAFADKGDFGRALDDSNQAIRLDPTSTVAYTGRALLWSRKGEYDKAIADHTEAIRLDPRSALAYYFRGSAWAEKAE